MKHIKSFNESQIPITDEIYQEIIEITEEVFKEYIIDYGMEISFQRGKYFKEFNFLSDSMIKSIMNNYPKHPMIFSDWRYSVKVELINGRNQRLEIYLDDNSQKLFDNSMSHLKSQLNGVVSTFEIKEVPKLSPELYSIGFFITYDI